MGDPRKAKKTYESPKKPWEKVRLEAERKIVTEYGIRRKKEIRRLETIIRDFRRRARKLIAEKNETEEKMLIEKVNRMGILTKKDAVLEDILGIELGNILERRLQTLVVKKGLARTVKQARQFITHGHITVNGQKIISPNYLVTISEENQMAFRPTSSLNATFHLAGEKPRKEEKPAEQEKEKEKDSATEIKIEKMGEAGEILDTAPVEDTEA